MKKRFDLVFGLGSACSCTQALRAAGLQFASFPLDWVSGATFRRRVELLVGGFDGWMEEADFEQVPNPGAFGHDTYKNLRTGLCHPHDFDKGVSLAVSMPGVRAKYIRRVERLFRLIAAARQALVVWMADPRDEGRPGDDDIRFCLDALSEKFPGTSFRMLVLECAAGVVPQDKREVHGRGFDVVSFDYRCREAGAKPWDVWQEPVLELLSAFSCVDYRTSAERRKQKARERERAYRRFAARSPWSFFVNRLEYRLWRHLERGLVRRGIVLGAGEGGGAT